MGVPHGILRVFNTILYENEFKNPQIFQQTISLFPEHSTLGQLLPSNYLLIMPNLIINNYFSNFFQWENHSKSMQLEAQTLAKIKSRINEKVMGCCGTWIDWQYLLDAAALLAKCRYTLQYTYPYAYYMEPSPRKELVNTFFLNCVVT
jgi:hypothetical protein